MKIKKLLGNNIKRYRKGLDLTQEELSERLGISQNHLSSIEIGKRFVSAELIEKIAKELNVSPATLFYDEKKLNSEDSIKDIKRIIDKELNKAKKEIIKKIIESI